MSTDTLKHLRGLLEEHWLFSVKCNHQEKTDDVACACGWTGTGYPSVGEAVSRWADHVCNVAEPLKSKREAALLACAEALQQCKNWNTMHGNWSTTMKNIVEAALDQLRKVTL